MYTSFHYGDLHFPFQDTKAVDTAMKILADLQPDLVVCHGDLVDCASISTYEKDPKHRASLAKEIEMAKTHLRQVSEWSPGARRILLKGNHEDRLRRLIWKLSEKSPAHEILNLPETEAALDWPSLLRLNDFGWEWHEDKFVLFNRMILKHGTFVRKWSGQSAKAEMERYGKSGISGHTHRQGAFVHRDWNGQHGWWEHGCLCTLNPTYTEDPDWQQGCCVVTWSDRRDYFSVELIHIHRGKAVFRGKLYAS